MSFNTNYSSSTRIIVNSNVVGYESNCLSEENKVAEEKQIADEILPDQPTDVKVSNSTKKTFVRKRENSNKVGFEKTGLSLHTEIIDITDPHVVETKTPKQLIGNIKSEKRRRHFSEGASSLPRKSDISSNPDRRSQILGSQSDRFDLKSNSPNSNEEDKKLHSGTQNICTESSPKNSKSGSALPNLRLSISSLDSSNFKMGPLTKRKMRVSTSENSVSRSPKGEVKIARKYIDSLDLLIKDVNEKEALVFDRTLDGFEIRRISNTKPDEIENCVRKILSKIKVIADYEFNDMGSQQDIKTFDEIISYLEQANWSASLFEKNSKSHLDIELAMTKKVVDLLKQQVANQIIIRNESASTELVGLFFLSGELEASEPIKKLTLDDLSLVFPKIFSLPELLSRIWQVLIQLKIYEPPHKKEPLPQISRVLEFCVKCFENRIALPSYLEHENDLRNLLESICMYASPEMQHRLNTAFDNTLKYADEMRIAAARSKFFSITKSCQTEKLTSTEGTKPEVCQNTGFYRFVKDLKGDGRQAMVCHIASSIVKKSASEFIGVPLDELLSGKLDSKHLCPCYMQMSDTINSFSYLVANEILSCKDVADRREVIFFYADVIRKCMALGDYASSYSLKMGFDLSCISRLRDTWNKDTKNQIQFLDDLFDHKNFYGNLFKATHNCQSNYFMIPLAIFGSKLNFIEQTLSKEVIKQSQLRRLARDVLIPIKKIQDHISNLSEEKILITKPEFDQILEGLKSSLPDEETLFNHSEKIEPRK